MKRVVYRKTDKTWEDSTKGVPIVITFHPTLTFFAKKIKELSYNIYIQISKLRLCLHLHLWYHFVVRNIGSRKYNNIESTNLFSNTVTAELYTINHYFNYDSKCLVYLITCRTCKLQYTGQTCHAFRKSGNNYKCCARKPERG